MRRVLPAFSSIVLGILQLSVKVDLLLIRRHFHDGRLFEDYAADSKHVRYTATNGIGWNNLDDLVANEFLRDKAMFCTKGPGAWLLHQEAEYQYGIKNQIKLLYGEYCVAADNINSLQPLGAVYVNIEENSGAIAFEASYFAANGKTTRDTISGTIKSAIFVGVSNWTIEMDGRKTCVIVLNMGDVCLLEDLQNSFNGSDQVTITRGCVEEDGVDVYHLQTCFSTGYHLLTYDFDFTFQNMQYICANDAYDATNDLQAKFLEVVDLWRKRMSPTMITPSSVPNAVERINTLHEMTMVMGKSCPTANPNFLEILFQIYMVLIDNGDIWNNTVLPDGTKIETSYAKWSRAQSFVLQCKNTPAKVDTSCEPEDVSEMKNEKEVAIIEDFLNGENYDYVIENIWLLLNYVSTYCNLHMGFKNNDWSIFPLQFKRDFLYPLQEQWKNPNKWSGYYQLMFHGFDMEEEKKQMISCVQAIIKETPFYDPLARPPGFYSGNHTDKEVIGQSGKNSTTKATTNSTASTRKKRQEENETVKTTTIKTTTAKTKKPKVKKSVATSTTTTTTASTTTTTQSPKSVTSKISKKSKKHKKEIKTIETTAKVTTLETLATTIATTSEVAVTPVPTVIDAGITTIEIEKPTTAQSKGSEGKDKDKKKKKKRKAKGKHTKKEKGKDEKKKRSEKVLKSTVVEKQLPPVTEVETTAKSA